MKNIHILPTDKPSRLLINWEKDLCYKSKPYLMEGTQNIYITSDEEIKDGNWFTDNNNSLKRSYKLSHVQFANPKKIILTTDQDLIKDGVQAIDDEFLEWFVKNPSCESVWIKEKQHFEADKSKRKNPLNGVYYSYKIIIPKEEPKQETLEEVAERLFKTYSNNTSLAEGHYDYMMDKEDFKEASLELSKWQQERSYSEEEVKFIISEALESALVNKNLELWFNIFKKK